MHRRHARFRDAERRLWSSVGAGPTERRVHLARNDVVVRVQELGDGPPVLFVHGTMNSGTSWAPLAARMDGFHRVLLDRPGCGSSDRLRDRLDLETFAVFAETVLVDVLDALELPSAQVVATSFGGYLALRTAAAHPDRVDRLVLLGWSLGAPNPPVPAVMRLANVPGLRRLFAAMPVNERAVRGMFRQIGLKEALAGGRVSQEMVDFYAALLNDTDTMKAELDQGPGLISPVRGMDDRVQLPDELLGRIRVPTYVLWGEQDPFGGPDSARHLTARIPGAQLELMPDAGHAVWLDDPDRVARTTAGFLRPEIPRAPRGDPGGPVP